MYIRHKLKAQIYSTHGGTNPMIFNRCVIVVPPMPPVSENINISKLVDINTCCCCDAGKCEVHGNFSKNAFF
jgi:hypothetical protein